MKKNPKNKETEKSLLNEVKEDYNTKILPFASNLGGAVIAVPNADAIKKKGLNRASNHLKSELIEIQKKINNFIDDANNTQKVYSAKFKFEPIVGETYFLYEGAGENYLSILAPENWGKKFIGAFRLNSDYKWEKINWNTI